MIHLRYDGFIALIVAHFILMTFLDSAKVSFSDS